jgi:hypothetical protein
LHTTLGNSGLVHVLSEEPVPTSLGRALYQLEYNMTGKTPISAKLSSRLSCNLSIALVALSLTIGASAVRADSETPPPSWREMLLDPITDAVKAVEDQLSGLEAKVASMARSFTTRQLTTQQLCVSDETGAQTCISKAQLDALLKTVAQAPAVETPVTVTEAKPAAKVEPAVLELVAEPAMVDTEGKGAAAVEPTDTATEAKAATAIETKAAAVVEPVAMEAAALTAGAVEPAAPAETTTIVTAPARGAVPEEVAMPEENAPQDQEPARTVATTSDAAVVGVEISTPPSVASDE